MLTFLYEDTCCAVVQKPSGLPVLPSTRGKSQTVSAELARHSSLFQDLPEFGIVHRLDNDTSGCLLVAKSPEAYEFLRKQFEEQSIGKEYLALVSGHLPRSGHITSPIAHHPRNQRRMYCHVGGQPADTRFTVLHYYPASSLDPLGLSLAQIQITTGVRHQIRVHLASVGHPIVGDTLYGHPRHETTHHLLHAASIEFESPETHARVRCEAPLPTHFTSVLDRIS